MSRKSREKSIYTRLLEHLYQTNLSLGRLTVYFAQREAIATTLVIGSRVWEAQTVVPVLEINFLYLQGICPFKSSFWSTNILPIRRGIVID